MTLRWLAIKHLRARAGTYAAFFLSAAFAVISLQGHRLAVLDDASFAAMRDRYASAAAVSVDGYNIAGWRSGAAVRAGLALTAVTGAGGRTFWEPVALSAGVFALLFGTYFLTTRWSYAGALFREHPGA